MDPRSAKRDPGWFRLPSGEVVGLVPEGEEKVERDSSGFAEERMGVSGMLGSRVKKGVPPK